MDTPKKYYNWGDVERAAQSIIMQMYKDEWRPDYIVGLTRGGLPLAVLISHMASIRMETLKVKLRDLDDNEEGCESNCWMAEDALGYGTQAKNILIVDDINDTGATFDWITKDWQAGCLPSDSSWESSVFGKNVRFAAMTENLSSNFELVKYYWDEVNKAEEDVWLVYPYE